MLIKVLGITQSEAVGKYKKKYKVVDVHYERDGNQEHKTLRGFSYPEVVSFFCNLEEFPIVVDVKSEKNEKGYWDWVSVTGADGAVPDTQKKPIPADSGPKKANVFEERDVRIVRQSSLERAVAVQCHNNPKGAVDPDACIALAEKFAAWVVSKAPAQQQGEDDIPF